jgi:hypothetical protein
MKSIVIKSPVYPTKFRQPSVFLAGSIEMGVCDDWQSDLIAKFPDGVTFLNPRRDDWDSSWEQSINNPKFKEQVTWELDNLAYADIIFLYFDPKTKSPISMLELGLFGDTGKMIVCCPEGFWRKGNVDVVCERLDIIVHEYLDTAIADLKNKLW